MADKDDGLYTALRFYFAADDPETGEPQGILLPPFGADTVMNGLENYDKDENARKRLYDWVKGADGHIKAVTDRVGKWSEYGEDPAKRTSRYNDVIIGNKLPSKLDMRNKILAENGDKSLEQLSKMHPQLFGRNYSLDDSMQKAIERLDNTNYDMHVVKGHKGTHKGASVLGLDDPDYVRYTWDDMNFRDAGKTLFNATMRQAANKFGRRLGFYDKDDKPNIILQGDAADRYRQWMKGENGDKGKSRYANLATAVEAISSMLTDWGTPMTDMPERFKLYSVKMRPEDMYTSKDIAEQNVTDWRDLVEEMTVKRLMPSKQLDHALVEDWIKGYLTKDRPDYDEFNKLFGAQLIPNEDRAPWNRMEFRTQHGVPLQDMDARYAWLFNRMFGEDPGHVVSDSTMKHIKKCLTDERTRYNVAGALSGLKY